MSDIFDVNQYKSENSRINLDPDQKHMITAKMYQTYEVMKQKNNTKKPLFVKSIAAVLAAAFISGAVYLGFNSNDREENWFAIKASATGSESAGDENNNASANGHSAGAMTGFFMENEEKTLIKDGYKDYFAYYHMENFVVTGANIRSVRVESHKKGIYFTLIPDEKFIPDDLGDTSKVENGLSDFKEKEYLNNSQYSFEELRTQAPYVFWPCDGFVFDNGNISSGKELNIINNGCIDIILEGDHSDPEIAEWTKEISSIGSISDKSNYNRYVDCETKIQKKMLNNAQISVTVTYADNTTETQLIDLQFKGNRLISFEMND